MTAHPRIDVPKEFSVCVRALGGHVLDDEKGAYKSENADYWFAAVGVVAELKCLTDNLMTSPEFEARIRERYAEWVREGLVPRPTTEQVTIDLKALPEVCAREITNILKRKLEPILRKANSQIDATKTLLDVPDATGLLILVNDGNHAHTPDMMRHLLARSTNGQLSSIDCVSYFTVNERAAIPQSPKAARFWIDWNLEGRKVLAQRFRDDLRGEWLRHLSLLTGGRIVEMLGAGSPDEIVFVTE